MEKSSRAQEMAQLLEDQAASGMNKKDFCRERDISPARFYYWQRRFREQEQAGFQQIAPGPDFQLEIRLSGGQWIGLRSHSINTLRSILMSMGNSHA